ncbi:MAG: alpha/beta fold hydrolase, partial [Gemmatimonadota bacterium]
PYPAPMPSTLHFLRHFLFPDPDAVVRSEVTYRRDKETLAASLYRPGRAAGARPLPGWVALHGLTHTGRDHRSLDGLARALAASGTAVLVPDIPEWRELHVAPDAAAATIRAAVPALADRAGVDGDRVGVMGFSFGGAQALVAATEPDLASRMAAVVSWGGYADLRRAARFLFLGEHELDGTRYHAQPDPYGRWILAGNYLTLVPEHRDDGALANALRALAREVGRRGVMAWEPATDPWKTEARATLDARQREIFDLLAPPAGTSLTERQRERVAGIVDRMCDAAMAAVPRLDPAPHLPGVAVPVFLAHGRDDRLFPWTELERLRRAIPESCVRHAVVTGLFAHSFRERRFPTPRMGVEAVRFVRAIRRMIRLI